MRQIAGTAQLEEATTSKASNTAKRINSMACMIADCSTTYSITSEAKNRIKTPQSRNTLSEFFSIVLKISHASLVNIVIKNSCSDVDKYVTPDCHFFRRSGGSRISVVTSTDERNISHAVINDHVGGLIFLQVTKAT